MALSDMLVLQTLRKRVSTLLAARFSVHRDSIILLILGSCCRCPSMMIGLNELLWLCGILTSIGFIELAIMAPVAALPCAPVVSLLPDPPRPVWFRRLVTLLLRVALSMSPANRPGSLLGFARLSFPLPVTCMNASVVLCLVPCPLVLGPPAGATPFSALVDTAY